MREAFKAFSEQITAQGLLAVWGEDTEALALAQERAGMGRRMETYGLDSKCDWRAKGVHLGNSAAFEVWYQGRLQGTCALQVPGKHNVLNALAALASVREVGVDFSTAAAALTRFQGTARRFEIKGQLGGVTVVDDYAHHPTEIRATLAAARVKYPGRTIWAVFQPHTYSRTKTLLDDFAAAFDDANHVLVTSIYAARESNSLGISGQDVVARADHPDAQYVETFDHAVGRLVDRVQPGDVVITLGAGDSYLIGELLLERLRN
jgi:UDP-N-acetylmuramate--alanine ligase